MKGLDGEMLQLVPHAQAPLLLLAIPSPQALPTPLPPPCPCPMKSPGALPRPWWATCLQSQLPEDMP